MQHVECPILSITVVCFLRITPSFVPFVCSVSVGEVEAVREGHQSEVLLSIADEFPANRCFTLVFRGRKGNLDLVAESAEEAQTWVKGIRKLIENVENMGEREKLDQYPFSSVLDKLAFDASGYGPQELLP